MYIKRTLDCCAYLTSIIQFTDESHIIQGESSFHVGLERPLTTELSLEMSVLYIQDGGC